MTPTDSPPFSIASRHRDFPPARQARSARGVHGILLSLLLALAAGCATSDPNKAKFSDNFSNREAVVKIPFEGDVAEVRVSVYNFPANAHANNGVAAMQIEDWAKAIEQLKAAVTDKPRKASFHFALAVACEASGQFAAAKTHYQEANRLAGGQGMFDAQAGLKRIAARGK